MVVSLDSRLSYMCSVYVGVGSLEIPKHGWDGGRAAIEWCVPTDSNPNVEGPGKQRIAAPRLRAN